MQSGRQPLPGWQWGLALFGMAFIIRLIYALQLPFPPLDDPAYYIQGARSLRAGHFFDMAVVWNYHPTPATVLHPGFDFWMPLTSFAIAAFMTLLGDTALAAQLPGVIAGSLLPTLTFYLGRHWSGSTLIGGLAGLYIALNPILAYQSAVPDSQMLYAALVAGALLVWPDKPSRGRAFGLGILIGLAYLTRSHAVFLALTWAALVVWQLIRYKEKRRQTLTEAGLTGLGLGLIALPWLIRNLLTFGFVNSPAGLESALIYDYATLFNYETPINFSSFAALGPAKILEARAIALSNAWLDVLSVMFLPSLILPVIGAVWLAWRDKKAQIAPALLYALLLGLGLPLIFVAASSTGSFYHSSGSLAPLGAVGYVYLLWRFDQWWRTGGRRRSLLPVLIGALIALEAFQFWVTVPQTIDLHRYNETTYARLGDWLKTHPAGEAVIADEPTTLNYATGVAALRLPSDEGLDTLQHLARRYGVRYVVVTHQFGRYPALLDTPTNLTIPQIYTDPQGAFAVYEVK